MCSSAPALSEVLPPSVEVEFAGLAVHDYADVLVPKHNEKLILLYTVL